jgi:hypothetical protein
VIFVVIPLTNHLVELGLDPGQSLWIGGTASIRSGHLPQPALEHRRAGPLTEAVEESEDLRRSQRVHALWLTRQLPDQARCRAPGSAPSDIEAVLAGGGPE